MSYSILDGVAYGNVPLSIFDIVEHLPEYFADLGMLITCMDSSTDVLDIASASNHEMWKGFEPHGHAIWLPPSTVAWQLENGWNCDGFEEVYLLSRPASTLSISDEKFTSEAADFAESVPAEFLERFRTTKAVRFLSDGCGLNYACEPDFASAIEDLDKYLQSGEPSNSFKLVDPQGTPRRAYYLPIIGPPNSLLARTNARRPGSKCENRKCQ
jgi:hypothetical protein